MKDGFNVIKYLSDKGLHTTFALIPNKQQKVKFMVEIFDSYDFKVWIFKRQVYELFSQIKKQFKRKSK